MTILDRLMAEVHDSRGSMTSAELAHRLGVTASALEGMIDVLMAKGHVILEPPPFGDDTRSCASTVCTAACTGFEGCPFVAAVPQPRRLVVQGPRLSAEHSHRRRAKNSVRMD